MIRGVASDAGAYDDVMMIRANLQTILGPKISVSAMLADNPIIRAGGKIPLIVQAFAKHTEESGTGTEDQASMEVAPR